MLKTTFVKDCNKEKLYENDICIYENGFGRKEIGIVKYNGFAWYIESINEDDEGNFDVGLHPNYWKKKIGNIYDNPELLERSK